MISLLIITVNVKRSSYCTFSFPLSTSVFSLISSFFPPFFIGGQQPFSTLPPPSSPSSSPSSMIEGIHILGLKLSGFPRIQDRMNPKNRSPYSFGGTAEIQCYSHTITIESVRVRGRGGREREKRTLSFLIPLKKCSRRLTSV